MLSKLNSLREKNEDGFTLIELLIVVVIIGILAAIAIPIFLNQQKAAIAGTVKSDVRNTVTNVATFLTKNPKANAAAITAAQTGTTPELKVVKSDDNVITIAGGWQDYTVLGTNPDLGTPSADAAAVIAGTDNGYVFDSATGKYVGAGAIK